jgi:integrase
MLELMARGGMRIGEVLKLRLRDLQDRKLIPEEPKSGREHAIVFIPHRRWPTGSGNMPLRSARALMIELSRFPVKVRG